MVYISNGSFFTFATCKFLQVEKVTPFYAQVDHTSHQSSSLYLVQSVDSWTTIFEHSLIYDFSLLWQFLCLKLILYFKTIKPQNSLHNFLYSAVALFSAQMASFKLNLVVLDVSWCLTLQWEQDSTYTCRNLEVLGTRNK